VSETTLYNKPSQREFYSLKTLIKSPAWGVKSHIKLIAQLILIIFTCSLYAEEKTISEIPGKNIHINQLEEMFSNVRENTDWDTSSDMLWGYFFTHSEPKMLEKAKIALIGQGFSFVDIFLSDKDEPNEPDKYWLHVERIETHSPITLDATNDKLYIFAASFGLDSYDGMDIGPVGK
jgi:hypothetical protein